MTPPTPVPDGEIVVRYWASARAAAGVVEERHRAATVGAALDAAGQAHPALAPILAVATFLLDGRAVLRAEPTPPGSVLEVLPPFAGG
jgi:molybdopterin converting factor small subunit